MPPTPSPEDADACRDRQWPPLRSALVDVAAALDRLDRAGAEDVRQRAEAAIRELLQPGEADRARRVLELYSRAYDPEWQARFEAGEPSADPPTTARGA